MKEKTVKKHEGEFIHIKKTWFYVFAAPFIFVIAPLINIVLILFDAFIKLIITTVGAFFMPFVWVVSGRDADTEDVLKIIFNPKKFIKVQKMFWMCDCKKK